MTAINKKCGRCQAPNLTLEVSRPAAHIATNMYRRWVYATCSCGYRVTLLEVESFDSEVYIPQIMIDSALKGWLRLYQQEKP